MVYDHAGLYDFVLQALYLHVAFFGGWAFNAPTWSVASEILAYCSFFLLASRYRKQYVNLSIVICLVALWIQSTAGSTGGGLLMINGSLARGLLGFYLGSLGYLAMRKLERAGHAALMGRACLVVSAVVGVLGYHFGYDAWIGNDAAANMLGVFFPLVFACLGIAPLNWLLRLRPLVVLGDLSYSIYLVHVPIQMIVLALASTYKIPISPEKPPLLVGYIATVIAVATLVRYTVEKPCSRWLRRRYGQPAPQVEAVPAAAS